MIRKSSLKSQENSTKASSSLPSLSLCAGRSHLDAARYEPCAKSCKCTLPHITLDEKIAGHLLQIITTRKLFFFFGPFIICYISQAHIDSVTIATLLACVHLPSLVHYNIRESTLAKFYMRVSKYSKTLLLRTSH